MSALGQRISRPRTTLATLPPPRHVGRELEPRARVDVAPRGAEQGPESARSPYGPPRIVPPAQARRSLAPVELSLDDAVSVDDDVLLEEDEDEAAFDRAFRAAFGPEIAPPHAVPRVSDPPRRAPAESYVAPRSGVSVESEPPSGSPISGVVVRRPLSALRYVVAPGAQPGEIVLRALAEDEPPPFGVPIAALRPTCPSDERQMEEMLWGL